MKRNKRKAKGPVANQLKDAAKPNVLKSAKTGKGAKSNVLWTADAAIAGREPDDDLEPNEVLDDDEEVEEEEADERTPAQRRADLQEELEREAEEFGLTGFNPVGLYGPNGKEVAALIDSLEEIDDELPGDLRAGLPQRLELVHHAIGAELGLREIAQVMGLSAGAVESLLVRARRSLKKGLLSAGLTWGEDL